MIRGCTETLTLEIEDQSLVLPSADNVFVSIAQGSMTITKTGEDITVNGNTVEVALTQQESLRLKKGTSEIQVNWLEESLAEGKKRIATIPITFKVDKQLLPKVLS